MMSKDPILVKAMERLKALREEVARLEEFFKIYNDFAGIVTEPTVPLTAATASRPKRVPPVKMKRPETVLTVESAEAFMTAANRPIPLSELLEEMERRHIPVGGKTPTATLDSRLRYSQKFQSIAGRGWWFKDRPIPQTNGSAADAHVEQSAAHDVHQPTPHQGQAG